MSTAILSQRCAVHPDREAVSTCPRCGNYACLDCSPGAGAVTDTDAPCISCERATGMTRYHVVPVWRFLLLGLVTFGVYQVYWMYKTWAKIKLADRSDIWPAVRAMFARFTYFQLLNDLNLYGAQRGVTSTLSSGWAIGYFVSSILYQAKGVFALSGVLSMLFLLPAVERIWLLSNDQARAAAGWSTRHTLLLLGGLVFTSLAVFGLSHK